MKKWKLSIKVGLLVAGLALAACGTPAQNDQATIVAKRILTAAHTLHDGAALSASAAANTGACVGACAVRVKDLIDRSEALLVAADGLSDPTNISADVDAAVKLIAEAQKGF